MEFKLKLCFQNDIIRFIGDKLDKISTKNKSIDYSEAALKV
jgi:hypothetical protein